MVRTFVLVSQYPDLGLHLGDPRRQVVEHLRGLRALSDGVVTAEFLLLVLQVFNLHIINISSLR